MFVNGGLPRFECRFATGQSWHVLWRFVTVSWGVPRLPRFFLIKTNNKGSRRRASIRTPHNPPTRTRAEKIVATWQAVLVNGRKAQAECRSLSFLGGMRLNTQLFPTRQRPIALRHRENEHNDEVVTRIYTPPKRIDSPRRRWDPESWTIDSGHLY